MALDPISAQARLGLLVLQQAARRDGIADSDLVDEQFVSVQISTTLGELRAAGLRSMPGYYPSDAPSLDGETVS